MKITFLSFGAGVQTTAMLIMLAQGKIHADAVIFADTGAEHPETYDYIERYDKPLCEKMGIPFLTVRRSFQRFPMSSEFWRGNHKDRRSKNGT